MVALTVLYQQGVPFDMDYYTSRHLPLVERVMKPLGMIRAEVHREIVNMDRSPAAHQVVASLYFESAAALRGALRNPAAAEVTGDVKHFYPEQPEFRIAQVL